MLFIIQIRRSYNKIYQTDSQTIQLMQNLAANVVQKFNYEDILRLCRQRPYEISSQMKIKYTGTSTYRKMLNEENQQKFIKQLQELGFDKLNDPIYLFEAIIFPQSVQWKFWKHQNEITEFLSNMDVQIIMMNKFKERKFQNGQLIQEKFDQFKSVDKFTQKNMGDFIRFLNLIVNHPFLRKSVQVLTFVSHCLPMNLWNLKVYQQVEIFKKKGIIKAIIDNFSHKQVKKDIDFYITITSDGVIRSTKNLLQTKIQKMIPFTNQFEYQVLAQKKDIIIRLSSCLHESIDVDLQQNYIQSVNFVLGMRKSIKASKVLTPQRFNSFSRPRKDCGVKLYNDGFQYFSDLCDVLDQARIQVCITDWWLTPYFLLKRPDDIQNTTNRIDGVLKKIADRGVKVFIILFREPLNMLCNDSQDAQFYLQSLSRNIRVRRHPIVPQLWSHHQKCVIIDQKIGFMGGLDICYGRWDDPQHNLTNKDDKWNGADYTNQRIRGFAPGSTKNVLQSPADREHEPRMPWHDIGIQLRGDAVIDLARHFIQYWYFVDAEKVKDPYSHLHAVQKRYNRSTNYQQPDWDDKGYDKQKQGGGLGSKLSLCGKRTQLFFTGTQRRLPQLLIEVRQGSSEGNVQLQLCRSASPWSIGAKKPQFSIHNAYKELISDAQHFIYIENQFFMGKQNDIVQSLAQRIRRAHHRRQSFKVIVVMPLLPGFEGDVTDRKNGPLRIQVYNQYQAILRGQNSLHQRLNDLEDFNIDNYIFFFGLRGHGILNKTPVTEIIYVHSKLMIVDDKRAIIGSANINDRSLLGTRDSQLAIIIEQQNGQNILDGKPRKQDIFDLKCRLFAQHFGLTPQECEHINSNEIWTKIILNAKNNTLIYRKLFGCYPDDTITTNIQVEERKFQAQIYRYNQLAPKIVAHAVQMPLDFLRDEDLRFRFGEINAMAGEETFL